MFSSSSFSVLHYNSFILIFFFFFFFLCKAAAATRADKSSTTHLASYSTRVCHISLCPNNGMAATMPVFGIFNMHTGAEMLVHATAHRGCMHTTELQEYALKLVKVYPGRKIPCCTKESNLHQHCAWSSGLMHAIAHRGCMYTIQLQESALKLMKVYPGRKIPYCTKESNLH